jgi:hypothetical protein
MCLHTAPVLCDAVRAALRDMPERKAGESIGKGTKALKGNSQNAWKLISVSGHMFINEHYFS